MWWMLAGGFPTLYELYWMYRYMLAVHGIYVTLSYLQWFYGISRETLVYIISYAYEIPEQEPCLLIQDKTHQKQS
jgi:hypothetical protein